MQQKPSERDALMLIADGTPEGRMYGFLALKEMSPKLFLLLSKRFLQSNATVRVHSGCTPLPDSMGHIVQLIFDGKISAPKADE